MWSSTFSEYELEFYFLTILRLIVLGKDFEGHGHFHEHSQILVKLHVAVMDILLYLLLLGLLKMHNPRLSCKQKRYIGQFLGRILFFWFAAISSQA